MPELLPSPRNRARRVAIPADPANPGTLPPMEIRQRIGEAVKGAILERFPTSPLTTCLFFGLVGARLASEVTGTNYCFQAGTATQLDDGSGRSYTGHHCWFAAGHYTAPAGPGDALPAGASRKLSGCGARKCSTAVEYVDLSVLAYPSHLGPRLVWGWTPEVFEPLPNYKTERDARLTTLTLAELQMNRILSWYTREVPGGLPAILFDQVHARAAALCGLPLLKPWKPWSREARALYGHQRQLDRLLGQL